MSVEGNLQVVEALIEAFNNHDLHRLTGFYSDAVTFSHVALAEPAQGLAPIRKMLKDLFTSFSDVHVEIERAFGQGDWVCLEVTATSTRKGIPLQYPECIVFKVEEDQVTGEHHYVDRLGIRTQLGLTT